MDVFPHLQARYRNKKTWGPLLESSLCVTYVVDVLSPCLIWGPPTLSDKKRVYSNYFSPHLPQCTKYRWLSIFFSYHPSHTKQAFIYVDQSIIWSNSCKLKFILPWFAVTVWIFGSRFSKRDGLYPPQRKHAKYFPPSLALFNLSTSELFHFLLWNKFSNLILGMTFILTL